MLRLVKNALVIYLIVLRMCSVIEILILSQYERFPSLKDATSANHIGYRHNTGSATIFQGAIGGYITHTI